MNSLNFISTEDYNFLKNIPKGFELNDEAKERLRFYEIVLGKK